MDALDELIAAASAELGVEIEAIQSRDGIVLMEIERTTGQPGSGRVAMERLCAYADGLGLPVTLAVSDYEPRLVRLYQELGFVVQEPEDEDQVGLFMVRRPGMDAGTSPGPVF